VSAASRAAARPAIVPADPYFFPNPPRPAEFPASRRLPSNLACPRCHLKAIHRSRRRGFDWFMFELGFWPARCFTCDKRFYVHQSEVEVHS
jgi:hypothetical protein